MDDANKSEEIAEEEEKIDEETEDTGEEKETSLDDVDLEDLTDEEYEALDPKIKKLVDAGRKVKSFQADYTRKTTTIAQQKKELGEIIEQIKEGQLTKKEATEETKTSLRGLNKLITEAQDSKTKEALAKLKEAFVEEVEDALGKKLAPIEQERAISIAKKIEGEIQKAQDELGSLYEKYGDTIKQELKKYPFVSWKEIFKVNATEKDLSKWLLNQNQNEQQRLRKKKEAVTFKEGSISAEKAEETEATNLADGIKKSVSSTLQKFPHLFGK